MNAVTVSTSDAAVLYCLTALHLWATRTDPEKRRPDENIGRSPGPFKVVMHFPTPESENFFLSKAQELLRPDSWSWTKLRE